ncbi:K(+)/H(+) antiporter [Dissophora globulifera]|uniref:K(+)/H(+) antiporter n=1 Tax=Dissophora globulifera TaxID=979702 RepID=A0A9P6R457_9FUNG|nr:K(+)/H(+) antiporter [Dissophora globulifera]
MNIFMHRIRQPKVISEVISGIILGPSILGQIPGFNNAIFPPQSIPFLSLVANLGLVLFLFLVGLELDPSLILKRAKHALGISITGILIPFVFSCGIAVLLFREFEQATATKPAPPFGEFLLTCGMAMSLTAFPVLCRNLAEMQLMNTTVGFITVCAAAAGDILAWILLALLVSLINATTPIMPLYVVLMAIGWGIVLIYIVRPLLLYLVRLTHSEEEPSQKMIAITLVIVLSSAFVTNTIGIHAIFGGFLVGLLIPHDSGFAEGLTRRIEDLVGVYFLPIFFTCSGLKTQVGLLNNGQTWGLVALVTVVSFIGKMIGCTTAARANGMTWREASSIGFLMNCKGLVEYIILNIGHDSGVIGDRVFVILIAMCILLTMISTPFIGYLYPVSYQKELEAKREVERKLQASRPKGKKELDDDPTAKKQGFLARLSHNLRRRRRGNTVDKEKHQVRLEAGGENYEDLDGVPIDADDRDSGLDDETPWGASMEQSWKKRTSIMFCLDKTPNAPGVMTLLQLFSGSSLHSRANQSSGSRHQGGSSDENGKKKHGTLQPSIDISDPKGNTRTQNINSASAPVHDILYSKIYAIRLLQISERTSAAMLTASRCMDRLYKDTVMMMVMAFAKLNSVPLKPLVAISTDGFHATVAQDILNRAEDLDVGWIVFPWNSSHLMDLPSGAHGYPSDSGNHLQPGVMMNMATTMETVASAAASMAGTPGVGTGQEHLAVSAGGGGGGASMDNVADTTLQFPYNVSRYFDHDEAQKISSGGYVDLSQVGVSHRTSIASNTKVLSKLIPSSAESNIATAVLVDRGLGLFGGVKHIIVPLLGGEDDFEALALASCLARSTDCFVTVLRIGSTQDVQSQYLLPTVHSRHFSSESSAPPTPRLAGQNSKMTHNDNNQWIPAELTVVPKDDQALFKKFFPTKPPFQGGHSHHQQRVLQRNVNLDKTGDDIMAGDAMDQDEDDMGEGVMALSFQDLGDAIQWARACLTAQDLMVMGFDSNAAATSMQASPGTGLPTSYSSPVLGQQQQHHSVNMEFSRVPSMEVAGNRQNTASIYLSSPTPTSPTSILERRGIALSPPRPDSSHQRSQLLQEPANNVSAVSTPGIGTTPNNISIAPQLRTSFQEERLGRPDVSSGNGGESGAWRGRRSRSKETRSIRSSSRGRRAATPGMGAEHEHYDTTCQVMLGLAADKMVQSGVISSLLVVRSRWFAQRKNQNIRGSSYHDMGLPLGHFGLHLTSTGTGSHHNADNHSHRRGGSTADNQYNQQILDQTHEYHSQQRQHHARQHSKASQELISNGQQPTHEGASSRSPKAPEVTFAGMPGAESGAGLIDDNLVTPRISHDSVYL